MESINLFIKSFLIAIITFQIFIILFRITRIKGKKEIISLGLIYLIWILRIIFYEILIIREISIFLLIWSIGNLLNVILKDERSLLWNIGLMSAVVIILTIALLGLFSGFIFNLFYIIILIITVCYPLMLIEKYYRITKEPFLMLLNVLIGLTFLAGMVDYCFLIFFNYNLAFSIWFSILTSLCMGYILLEKSYLINPGTNYYQDNNFESINKLQNIYQKLLHTENTLKLQERFITLGHLATSIVHEFKNIIGLLKLSAEYGIKNKDKIEKDKSLSVILENIEHASSYVTGLLRKIARQEELEPEIINVKQDLEYLMPIIRANYRIDKIKILYDLEEDIHVYLGKGEIELILFNIIRNASEVLKNSAKNKRRIIQISGKKKDHDIVIDIMDNGGGINNDYIDQIFDLQFSVSGSTGLGLYLCRMLVQKNRGNLEYIPIQGGSCFRITLPNADYEIL